MVTVQKQIASASSGGEAHSLKRSHLFDLFGDTAKECTRRVVAPSNYPIASLFLEWPESKWPESNITK
jgi:hypothetical protein